jgi:hypothetical protein
VVKVITYIELFLFSIEHPMRNKWQLARDQYFSANVNSLLNVRTVFHYCLFGQLKGTATLAVLIVHG